MATTFDFPFSGDTTSLLQRAKSAVTNAGGTLRGDTNSGDFSGKGVEGRYEVKGQTVHVTITKKPVIVPDSTIESQLRSFFETS